MPHKIIIDLKNPSNLKSFHTRAQTVARTKQVQVECNRTRIVFSVGANFNRTKALKEAAGSIVNSCQKGGIKFDITTAMENEAPFTTYASDHERAKAEIKY